EALKKVNNDQQEAERAVASFVAGDYDNLHQLLIKTERAQLSLQLAVQVTSKAIAAYQEISRMQI
ncbi:MAG: flagellar hook-basal body complex protein FliE, partial [Firmicutes bacterium]|nr:flagellar hook-basal body complex protein FliE [Bacillota bacterium]